jgi:preprotein translocase subunit SecG
MPYNSKIMIILPVIFLILSLIIFYIKSRKKIVFDIHGSARWANREEIIQTGLLDDE